MVDSLVEVLFLHIDAKDDYIAEFNSNSSIKVPVKFVRVNGYFFIFFIL